MMSLREELATVNVRAFHEPALDSIFAEYRAFIATGAYPYIDSVVSFVAERHGLPYVGQHHDQYVRDLLGKALGHQVYLASGQWKVREMREQEAEYVAQGYAQPITTLVPRDGLRIAIATTPPILRCKQAGNDWALCPPRKQSGFSLNSLVAAHQAYELATRENQTRMNGPRVVMYREEV
jgi:hypothetical protein